MEPETLSAQSGWICAYKSWRHNCSFVVWMSESVCVCVCESAKKKERKKREITSYFTSLARIHFSWVIDPFTFIWYHPWLWAFFPRHHNNENIIANAKPISMIRFNRKKSSTLKYLYTKVLIQLDFASRKIIATIYVISGERCQGISVHFALVVLCLVT